MSKCKGCERNLPRGYEYSYCEYCRNKQTKLAKKVVKVASGVLAGVAVIITKVKSNLGNK